MHAYLSITCDAVLEKQIVFYEPQGTFTTNDDIQH